MRKHPSILLPCAALAALLAALLPSTGCRSRPPAGRAAPGAGAAAAPAPGAPTGPGPNIRSVEAVRPPTVPPERGTPAALRGPADHHVGPREDRRPSAGRRTRPATDPRPC